MKLRNLFSAITVALCLMVPAGTVNAADELAINDTNFPGSYYKAAVRKYDTDNNGSLSSSEIAACKSLSFSLDGNDIGALHSFTALTELSIRGSSYATDLNVDLTKFPNLESLKLDAFSKAFSQLNFSKSKKLKSLTISGYKASTLDISACSALEEFILSDSNVSTVDLSYNTKLKKIDVSLDSIDLTKNTALQEARLALKTDTVDLSKNTNLTKLVIPRVMKDVEIGHLTNLTWLDFDSFNGSEVYNLNKLTKLEHLHIGHCNVTETDFTKFPKLTYLDLGHSRVKNSSIDVSGMTNLETLNLYNVWLDSLDVSANTKLKELNIGLTGLTGINLSKNTALTNLSSAYSKLTSLNVSKNTNLERLTLTSNTTKIASLDLSKNTKLTNINIDMVNSVKIGNCPALNYFNVCSVSSLEIGKCPLVTYFYCYNTSLEFLDLSTCPFIYKAYNTLEKTQNGSYINVEGEIQTEVDGKIKSVRCVMRFDAATKINAENVLIDASIFPDDGFRAAIAEQGDTDGDGFLSKAEIKNFTSLDCSGRNISSLKGLEYLEYLTSLNCSNNQITSLNTNLLTRLKKLNCSNNLLGEGGMAIDKSPLVNLNCSNNKLIDLDGIPTAKLDVLNASDNQITGSYTLKNCKKVYLKNNKLTSFSIRSTMEYIDVSNNAITDLRCDPFESVTGPYALTEIRCQNNKIRHLDFSEFDNLTACRAYGNPKGTVNLSKTMSDVMNDVKIKKYEGIECEVLGDKFIIDSGNEYTYFLKIDSNKFPDPGLLKAVKKYDLDKDGYLDTEEAEPRSFDCSNMGIKDLTGLEFLTIHDIDCSFNDLTEFDYSKVMNNYVSHKVSCYGNPNLKAVMIGTRNMKEIHSVEEKTGTFKVGGKDVALDYDSYADYRKEVIFNVDKGCRLVGTPVYLNVVIPEGVGKVTGDGMYEMGSLTELVFEPADGIEFTGWFENDELVCKYVDYSFTIDSDRTLTVGFICSQKLSFDNAKVERAMGDKPFAITVKGAQTEVTYTSDNAKVATVDAKTGTITLVGAGECTITAKAAATEKYTEGTASYKLVVNAKPTATPSPTPTSAAKPTVTPTNAAKPTGAVTPTTAAKPTGKADPTTAPADQDPKSQILAFVERIYIYVLDREPEEEGAAFWSDELYSFRRSGAEVAQGFIFSEEFTNRNTTDKEFVTILYKTFFGRDPEEEGFNFWVGELASGSKDRVTVANGFIYSQEWADTCASYGIRSGGDLKPSGAIEPTELTYAFVERMYTTALGRGYDEEGKQYWASELANFNITGESVGAFFFLSDEMNGYGLSDQEYLNRLYATFMNREPDADGAAYWLSVLNSGTPRADVVFGFTRSPEFTEKCVEARILPY